MEKLLRSSKAYIEIMPIGEEYEELAARPHPGRIAEYHSFTLIGINYLERNRNLGNCRGLPPWGRLWH
jgi:hypothetical protein